VPEFSLKSDYRQRLYDRWISQKNCGSTATLSAKDYQKWANYVKAKTLDWLPGNRQTPILDLGCGPGFLLYSLAQLGYTDLTGVDLSSEQVMLARQWCSRARIIQGDAGEFLAQNTRRFGLITGFDFIEHFRKDEILPLLTLVAQGLVQGGRVILQTPNAESPWAGSLAYGDFSHEWFFTPASLAQVMGHIGLQGFEARSCGPVIHGFKSLTRSLVWKAITLGMAVVNLAETGMVGSGIYTRVFLATAVKP
jgi:2-polyprenyl-3-methyl-5-hydroxy-6-metoxy-1,4-benzoquinol methylase